MVGFCIAQILTHSRYPNICVKSISTYFSIRMLLHCSPQWIPKAGVLPFSHDFTKSSLSVIISRVLGSSLPWPEGSRAFWPFLCHTLTCFRSFQFSITAPSQSYCLVGYAQNSLWFLSVLSAQSFRGSPDLSVLWKRGEFGLSHRPPNTGEVATSSQRIPRNLGIGVSSVAVLKSSAKKTAVMSGSELILWTTRKSAWGKQVRRMFVLRLEFGQTQGFTDHQSSIQ